ncbi:MAG: hypothetical protein GC179_04065 [Anaerolineaceae bacterium]|nr:hypothetical protein [Anaerolineaceae bacterium]
MSNPELPPDPEALEAWEKLPKNAPSPQALPPMTGGTRWVWGLLIVVAIIIIFGLLQGRIG